LEIEISAGASAAAGAAAAIAQATKASGVIVRVNRDDFLEIVSRNSEPLVVEAAIADWRSLLSLTYHFRCPSIAK
jgi:hypothetical protein